MMEYTLHIILANGANWAQVATQLRRIYFYRNNMGEEEKKYIHGNNLRNFKKELIAVAILIALSVKFFDLMKKLMEDSLPHSVSLEN